MKLWVRPQRWRQRRRRGGVGVEVTRRQRQRRGAWLPIRGRLRTRRWKRMDVVAAARAV